MTLDLIAKLESASEGSRALDIEAAIAFGWVPSILTHQVTGTERVWKAPDGKIGAQPPAFTTSQDAAIMAVPIGWIIGGIGQCREDPAFWWATLSQGWKQQKTVTALTAPLAITAAGLRAMIVP